MQSPCLLSPLNLIWNTADRLQTLSFSTPDNQRVIKFDDLMNIKYAAELARTLLPQFSLDISDSNDFAPELVNLESDVIAYIKHLMHYFAGRERNMSISYSTGIRRIPPLYVDKMLIQRTLFNVLLNAVKYGTEGTEIVIFEIISDNEYRIAISNDGIGVSPHDADFIFQQEFRCENAKRLANGNGHGLYLCKCAMERHSGDLVLYTIHAPTEFHLIFPKHLERQSWQLEMANDN